MSGQPSDWSLVGGEWDVDAQINYTNWLSGGTSYHIVDGSDPATKLVTKQYPIGDINTPVTPAWWAVNLVTTGNVATAGKEVQVDVEYLDITGAVVHTETIYSGIARGIDWIIRGKVFELETLAITPSAFRLAVFKPTDHDFDLYIDALNIEGMPPSFDANEGSDTTTIGSWKGLMGVGTFNNTSATTMHKTSNINAIGVLLTVPEVGLAGRYQIDGKVMISEADAGDLFTVRLRMATSAHGDIVAFGDSLSMHAGFSGTAGTDGSDPANDLVSLSASTQVYLNPRDTVDIEINQQAGAVPATIAFSQLHVTKIEE